ncbi:MAG: phosphatidate cytidylyltransferase [Fimbriimonadaceae bacterium]
MSSASDPSSDKPAPRVAQTPNSTAQRVRTALMAGVVSLAAILATSEYPIYILATVLLYFASVEIKEVFGGTSKLMAIVSAFSVTATLYLLRYITQSPTPIVSLVAVAIGTIGIALRIRRQTPHFLDALALGWLAGPIACALWLHNESADSTRIFSPNLLVLVALPIWLGDAAAYFFGRKFGKKLLAPSISPKKTIEGAIANLITCVASSLIIGQVLNQNLTLPIPIPAILIVGTLTGILGQIGDLLESALKRSSGVKDSGSILPGHGGILDRMDSFLFAAVPASFILWLLARNSFM